MSAVSTGYSQIIPPIPVCECRLLVIYFTLIKNIKASTLNECRTVETSAK